MLLLCCVDGVLRCGYDPVLCLCVCCDVVYVLLVVLHTLCLLLLLFVALLAC